MATGNDRQVGLGPHAQPGDGGPDPALPGGGRGRSPFQQKNVTVLGAAGMLGQTFLEVLREHPGTKVFAFDRELDITSADAVAQLLPSATELIINCAAYTNVDAAESEEELATQINGVGVAVLAAHAKKHGIGLVHFGTDYVFSGPRSEPWSIDSELHPLGAYGRSKAAGERALGASGCDFLNVRTSWLYAPFGKNFVRTIDTLARSRSELKVVDDQRGRPTLTHHLARTTLTLWLKNARGTFHVTDGGECSWYEFAREIVRLGGHKTNVLPCTTAEFPRPAPRPPYSVLDLSDSESLLGAMPSWQKNLSWTMARLSPSTH